MAIPAWIFLGLASGYLVSQLVTGRGAGTFRDILLGIVGAVVGGVLFDAIGVSGKPAFNFFSLYVAVGGAFILLAAYHALMRDTLRR